MFVDQAISWLRFVPCVNHCCDHLDMNKDPKFWFNGATTEGTK